MSIKGIFATNDLVSLAIMAIIAVSAGVAMQRLSAIITATVGAMALFAVATFLRAATLGGKNASALMQTDWHGLLLLQAQVLFAYAICFAAIIALAHSVRTTITR